MQHSLLVLLLLLATPLSAASFAYPNSTVTTILLPVADSRDFPSFTLPPSLSLDRDRPARLVIADHTVVSPRDLEYGDATSPHCAFQVQLPVLDTAKVQHYHTVYSLVTDDVAQLLARDGQATPAKLAEIAPSLITRRGTKVVESSEGASVTADFSECVNPFKDLLQLTTQAPLPSMPGVPNPLNSVFLTTSQSADIASCEQLTLALNLPSSVHEPIANLFASTTPISAYRFTGKLGADTDEPPKFHSPFPGAIKDFMFFKNTYLLKYGGAPVAREGAVEPDVDSSFEWQDGHFVWFEVPIKSDSAAIPLPPGTTLASNTATIFVAWYPTARLNKEAGISSVASDNFPYHEMGIRIPVKTADGAVYWHVVYILVDDEIALLLGRDMLGTPKKMAEFRFNDGKTLTEEGGSADFSISRRGVDVMKFVGTTAGERALDSAVPGLTDDDQTDLSVFAAQFPLHFGEGGEGAPMYVEWKGGWELLESREVVDAQVVFSQEAEECIGAFLEDEVVRAGALRWNYGKSKDLRSRPTVGKVESEEEGREYWEATYQLKYGGLV